MKKDFKDNYLKRPYKILKDILEKKNFTYPNTLVTLHFYFYINKKTF